MAVDLSRALERLVRPVRRGLALLVSRGVVALVNDALKLQGLQVQLLADEVRDDVERFQEFGFTSHPLPGAEAIVVFVGGSRAHGAAIAVDDRRYRPKGLQPGESMQYNAFGCRIYLKADGTVEVIAPGEVLVTSPRARFTGDVEVAGSVHVDGDLDVGGGAAVAGALSSNTSVEDPAGTMQEMRGVYNGHKHQNDGHVPLDEMT